MCPSTVPHVVFRVKRKACHRAQLWRSACIVCEANGQQRAAAWGGVHQEACPHHLPTQCCCHRARSHRRHAARKAGQLRPLRTISMHTPVSRHQKTRLRPACLCSKQYHQQSYRMEARGMSRTRGRHGRPRYASERSQEGVSVTTSASSPVWNPWHPAPRMLPAAERGRRRACAPGLEPGRRALPLGAS